MQHHIHTLCLLGHLRCNLEYAEALSICIDAHEKYPDHPDIDAEFQVLTSILGLKPYPEDDTIDSEEEDVLSPTALEKSTDSSQQRGEPEVVATSISQSSVANNLPVYCIFFYGKYLPQHEHFLSIDGSQILRKGVLKKELVKDK